MSGVQASSELFRGAGRELLNRRYLEIVTTELV